MTLRWIGATVALALAGGCTTATIGGVEDGSTDVTDASRDSMADTTLDVTRDSTPDSDAIVDALRVQCGTTLCDPGQICGLPGCGGGTDSGPPPLDAAPPPPVTLICRDNVPCDTAS